VTLVAGPVALPTPHGVQRTDVRSALQMHAAVMAHAPRADVFIATAAVADWRPAQAATEKIKKDGSGQMPTVVWQENPDILAELAASPRAQSGALFCVGFAAESQDLQAQAQAKRLRKGVPLMVGNIGPATFGADENALLLIDPQGSTEWPRASKLTLARQLVADIARRLT
jgi:phosphopantothenoylcysteine decarboxylase/phosphopantothenate--cysteine ligase